MASCTFLFLFAVAWSCTLFQPAHLQTVSSDPDDIEFLLNPNAGNINDIDTLVYLNPASVSGSRYSSAKGVLVLIHGFAQDYTAVFPRSLIAAYLAKGDAATWNIISVDWDALSNPQPLITLNDTILSGTLDTALTLLGYPLTVPNVAITAQRVADFLKFLNITAEEEIHIIGMSEGAHVAGVAASIYRTSTSVSVARVTGLDPAGPLFQGVPAANRLDETDADYVDVVHTNQGEFGYVGALGHADYYVNGGGPTQPCCNILNLLNVTAIFCAHATAIDYYTQSIPASFTTKGCKPLLGILPCSLGLVNSTCTTFGEQSPTSACGKYCISLTDNSPCS